MCTLAFPHGCPTVSTDSLLFPPPLHAVATALQERFTGSNMLHLCGTMRSMHAKGTESNGGRALYGPTVKR